MSHKAEVHVVVNDKESLINALHDMGLEVVEGKQKLDSKYRFSIDCDLSVKKNGEQLMIGFSQQKDSTFKMEADFYGTGLNSREFQKQVNVGHGKHKVSKWFNENRYTTTYEKDEEGNLVVVGTKW